MDVLDGLLKEQIRGDEAITGMLARYKDRPAFFYQKSPPDTDRNWVKPCYPRIDYNIDMRSDAERKTSGVLTINVWCSSESAVMPEDIEKRVVELISGTFYTNQSTTVCAIWNRSDAFHYEMPVNVGGNTAPEIFGVTLLLDLTEFPEQITTDPDPIWGLNAWTKLNFPSMTVITEDNVPAVWKPSDANPAVYWRFEGTVADDRQSYAVNWYTGQFAAHIITNSVAERNRWTKSMIELIQLEGEVILQDESPMFVKSIAARHGGDPLRMGQLLLTGKYGVLTRPRKEPSAAPLNHAIYTNLELEVNAHDRHDRRKGSGSQKNQAKTRKKSGQRV